MFEGINAKAPYFSTDCNATQYKESVEHLETKFGMFRAIFATQQKSKNKKTKIYGLTIEKIFNNGSGQERRADVYYEKEYKLADDTIKREKYAIEVQKSNASYENLEERTRWYKNNGIAVIWVVVAPIFNKEAVEVLDKRSFNIPLLSLVSHSLKINDNRFFVFDLQEEKLISLTLNNPNFKNFNNLDENSQRITKKKLTREDLLIVSNELDEDGHAKLLPYMENRKTGRNFYTAITTLSASYSKLEIQDKVYDLSSKTFKFKKFKTMVESTVLLKEFKNKSNNRVIS
jgi:competence CoiA-like predicted nuclease